ncbi:response regulator [candidate division WWE3 bacterium]|uniref:Response regulator n=1 Tax=candidate division WWE3 bacterium TaxID=2053526 RepID=A0A955RS51_UNCKA|nr:response regulator [candidate division WWE3 bacterium]
MQGEGKSVLFVEDERAYRKVVVPRLVAEGMGVIEADTGESGVKLGLAQHPEVVIIDIMLPGMDGWEVLRRIREDKEWGYNVPVILLTSLTAQKPPEDIVNQTTIYLEKTAWDLNDIVRVVKEAASVCDYYKSAGKTDWDLVEVTGKIKQRMGLS